MIAQREIRTITAEESDEFLQLLCTVFGLDFGRAKQVFYTDPLYDLERKWALFESGKMVSILTTTGLEFGWGKAIGIAGVATLESERRKGLGSALIKHVLEASSQRDESPAMLFANQPQIYAAAGFEEIDEVIQGVIPGEPETNPPKQPIGLEVVKELYRAWSIKDQNRLQRDESRWRLWQYSMRAAYEVHGGYVTIENGLCREIIPGREGYKEHLPEAMWLGLKSMGELLELEIQVPRTKMLLMARGLPAHPQLFMSDQF